MPRSPGTLWLLCLVVALPGCGTRHQARTLVEPARAGTLDHKSPYLKVHMRDGSVYVLSSWSVVQETHAVTGNGRLLDANRVEVRSGPLVVPFDSVALFETNVVHTAPQVGVMAVLSGVSAAVTVYCLTNTKACFGSCPTFYVSDGTRPVLQAEGFSASIAPTLEARDIDALYRARPTGTDFRIDMKNEALETHVIRYVHVLAARRPPGGRVFATGRGEFWQADRIMAPARCAAAEGDCAAEVAALDDRERFSATDSTDLATREVIELDFPGGAAGSYGLVIGSRQTLLTTYLLYQTLAWMGSSATGLLASLHPPQGDPADQRDGLLRLLGPIEVQLPDGDGWRTVGSDAEVGPLAVDVRIVPLPDLPAGPVHLRLRLTRGHWRLNYLALAHLVGRTTPERLDPIRVLRDGRADATARRMLIDSAETLMTLPGDAYALHYRLPADYQSRELFLESRGYYLEWMREEWLQEESPARLAMALPPADADPAGPGSGLQAGGRFDGGRLLEEPVCRAVT